MDTSKTFIKMCEKAEEIQVLRLYNKPFQDGDWWISRRWGDAIPCAWRAYRGEDDIWLPRQDQLQAILINPANTQFPDILTLLRFFSIFVAVNSQFTSMEQIWLAFVMSERWNKRWDGENWIAK